MFCYSRADLLKREHADAVLDFVKFWKTAYGELPSELVFDSKLTTYRSQLNQMGITFMTLRRRSPAILREVANTPRSAWRTVHLDVPHRMYQTPKLVDQQVTLRDYEGSVRQMLITAWGMRSPRSCSPTICAPRRPNALPATRNAC